MTITIRLYPLPGTQIAEDKEQARELRMTRLLPALASGEQVELDFEQVSAATQSYIHALLSEAIRRYGDVIFEQITFRNCSSDIQAVVRTVFEYTFLAAEMVDTSDGESRSANETKGGDEPSSQ